MIKYLYCPHMLIVHYSWGVQVRIKAINKCIKAKVFEPKIQKKTAGT